MSRFTLLLYCGAIALLCVPAVGNLLSDEVNWTLGDFVVAGILLLSTATIIDQTLRRVTTLQTRTLLIVGSLLLLAVIWLELAVGIFGSPFAGS